MTADYTAFLSKLHKRNQQIHRSRQHIWQSKLVLDPLLNQLSHHKKDIFFVQIGACDGVLHDPIRPFILRYGWNGILVEPLPDLFEQLKENYAGKNGLIFENIAIAEYITKKSLYRIDPAMLDQFPEWAAGCGTFVENSKNIATKPEMKNHIIAQEVETIPLETLLTKHNVSAIDMLQIDTEGYDYKVLSQVDFSRYKPLVINMEFVHLTDEEKMSTYALLNEQGYAYRTHHLDILAAQKSFLDTLS